jgi:hypothetical protein
MPILNNAQVGTCSWIVCENTVVYLSNIQACLVTVFMQREWTSSSCRNIEHRHISMVTWHATSYYSYSSCFQCFCQTASLREAPSRLGS